jgi:hypothetical protein
MTDQTLTQFIFAVVANSSLQKKRKQKMINKIKTYFNLDRPYEFDITDITAVIYTICAMGVMLGADMTVLFFIGSAIATAFCWQARRLNLVLLNVALFAMNCYYLICLIGG